MKQLLTILVLTLVAMALLACGTAAPADQPPQEFALAQPPAQEDEATPVPTAEPDPQEDQHTPEPADSQESEPTQEPDNGGDSSEPTPEPTPEPTEEPTPERTEEPEPTPEPTVEPTSEPTVTPEPTATPVRSLRCYTYQDGEKCFYIGITPTPRYPDVVDQLGIPAQEAEDAIAEARAGAGGQSDSANAVVVPNLKIVVVMDAGASPNPVLEWMEDQNLVYDHTRGRGWLERWRDDVPGIYVVHTFGADELTGGYVYAVLPAHWIVPLRKVNGVSHLMDGEGQLPPP